MSNNFTFLMDLLEQTPYLTQTYLPEEQLIIATWQGDPEGPQWREPLENQQLFIKAHKVNALLLDIRELGVLDPEDSEWTNSDFVPRQIACCPAVPLLSTAWIAGTSSFR